MARTHYPLSVVEDILYRAAYISPVSGVSIYLSEAVLMICTRKEIPTAVCVYLISVRVLLVVNYHTNIYIFNSSLSQEVSPSAAFCTNKVH